MADADYIRALAEQGEPEAQYLMGKMLYPARSSYFDGYGHISRNKADGTEEKENRDEALKWWLKAAEQGERNAQFNLGFAFRDEPEHYNEALKWFTKASEQGDRVAQGNLAGIYERGTGVPQNYGEAYFWSGIAYNSTISKRVAAQLSAEEKAEVDARIKAWRASHAGHPKDNIEKSINIGGLVCHGQSKLCKIMATCGDLAGIICAQEEVPYYIVNTKTKKIVSRCAFGSELLGNELLNCRNLVPAEWTCESPPNMPLSQVEAAAHGIKGSSIVGCGEILGVDNHSATDGPYYFIKKDTGEKIGECNHWTGSCHKQPAEWTCGWPSNYH